MVGPSWFLSVLLLMLPNVSATRNLRGSVGNGITATGVDLPVVSQSEDLSDRWPSLRGGSKDLSSTHAPVGRHAHPRALLQPRNASIIALSSISDAPVNRHSLQAKIDVRGAGPGTRAPESTAPAIGRQGGDVRPAPVPAAPGDPTGAESTQSSSLLMLDRLLQDTPAPLLARLCPPILIALRAVEVDSEALQYPNATVEVQCRTQQPPSFFPPISLRVADARSVQASRATFALFAQGATLDCGQEMACRVTVLWGDSDDKAWVNLFDWDDDFCWFRYGQFSNSGNVFWSCHDSLNGEYVLECLSCGAERENEDQDYSDDDDDPPPHPGAAEAQAPETDRARARDLPQAEAPFFDPGRLPPETNTKPPGADPALVAAPPRPASPESDAARASGPAPRPPWQLPLMQTQGVATAQAPCPEGSVCWEMRTPSLPCAQSLRSPGVLDCASKSDSPGMHLVDALRPPPASRRGAGGSDTRKHTILVVSVCLVSAATLLLSGLALTRAVHRVRSVRVAELFLGGGEQGRGGGAGRIGHKVPPMYWVQAPVGEEEGGNADVADGRDWDSAGEEAPEVRVPTRSLSLDASRILSLRQKAARDGFLVGRQRSAERACPEAEGMPDGAGAVKPGTKPWREKIPIVVLDESAPFGVLALAVPEAPPEAD